MEEQPIKVVHSEDDQPFVWLLVTEKAKEIYTTGLFDLYTLFNDDTESLIEGYDDLIESLENGYDIGIEVGHINLIQ